MEEYTLFDRSGLPMQFVRCPESEINLYRVLLGAADILPGRHLTCRLVDGELVDSDVRTPARVEADVRLVRDALLRDSDILALRALEALLPPELAAYRQELRDYPSVASNGVPFPKPR